MAAGLAARLPVTCQAIGKRLALLAGAGVVLAEPGERRRARCRPRPAPTEVAQQFLTALARDWDGALGAPHDQRDPTARGPAPALPREPRGRHG